MLSTYVCLILRERKDRGRKDLQLGHHTMHIGSAHVYEPQWQSALAMVDDEDSVFYRPLSPDFFPTPASLISRLWTMANTDVGIDPRKSPLMNGENS